MVKRVRSWLRSGVAAAGLIGVASTAWAASVDLTVAPVVPTTTTLTPFTYTVQVGNALTGSVATNAVLTIPLPANLYDVSIQSVTASGSASCPTPGAFTGGPVGGAVTSGSEVLTATVPSLPAATSCLVTIVATPLAAKSYTMTATITPGSGDTEVNPDTNTAAGNTATARVAVPLKVDKTIFAGATHVSGDQWNATGYNTDIVYEVRFENQSTLDLPLGAMGDAWADWEGNWAPQSTPQSSTLSNLTCVSGPCPPLTIGTVGTNQGSSLTPFTASMAGYVLPAGQSVVIRYTRRYAPPICGQAQIANDITWNVNQTGNYLTPQWQPNSYNANGAEISRTVLNFPASGAPACTGLGIQPLLGKTLDRVTDASGAVTRPGFAVTADGDRAHFTITIDNTRTDTSAWPASAIAAGAHNVPFSIWDVVRSVLGNAVSPTVYPAGVATQEVIFDQCSSTGTGSVCPAVTAGTVLKPPSTDFTHGQSAEMRVAAGETMTIRLSTRYAFSQPVLCVRNNAQIENFIGLATQAAPAGFAYTGTQTYPLYQEVTTVDKVSLLPGTPRCADVSANKTMSPSTALSGQPITFTLDYVNSTALATANPYNAPSPLTDVGVSDVLGANFVPTAVSCAVEAGVAQAPAVSLADITGPDHTFATVIPSMNDGAVVRCQITGSVSQPGSYRNVTAVALAANSGLVDPYTTNNLAALNYGIIGPRVELTKTGSLGAGGAVTFTVAARSVGEVPADGTVVADVVPAGMTGVTWTCVAAGGAACPQASGSGGINATLATFPSGGSVTWTISGQWAPTPTPLVNRAEATPPAGSSCVTTDPTQAPTAPPCIASATVGVPAVGTTTAFEAGSVAAPNSTVTYTVSYTSNGGVAADGSLINDPVPAGVASQTWTCVGTGGAICPAASGTGPINGTVTTFPVGGTLVYTVVATLTATPPATLVNTSTITPPSPGICATGSALPCTAQTTIAVTPPSVGTNTAFAPGSTVTPNGTVNYTVDFTSSGPGPADGSIINDPMPAGVASQTWTCVASGGAVCPAVSGTGPIAGTVATFPNGGRLVYSVAATLTATPPATLVNTSTITPPAGGTCANGSPVPCTATANIAGAPVAVGTSTAFAPGTTLVANGTVSYTVEYTSSGGGAADGSTIHDPVPAGVVSQTWTCTASGGAVCPAASGTGPITGTVATFPTGGRLVYTVTATLGATPPASLVNTSTITPPAGGVCADASTAPCTATTSVAGTGSIAPVPVNEPWALGLLVAVIGWFAARQRRRPI